MIVLQNITYIHPDKEVLFDNLNLTVNTNKMALIGHNGTGKSTLLKIIAGRLQPSGGTVTTDSTPYYIPQIFGQFNDLTLAQALRIEDKLKAFNEILAGHVTETNLTLLNDDWTIEDRCRDALAYWKLEDLDLNQPMHTLSGGQKTKVFLAGISIHQPEIVLLDEPSNHLDTEGRQLLYDFIQSGTSTILVVSHDRTLLNRLDSIYELSNRGITMYGGNYDFYAEQKQIEGNALNQDVKSKEKALRRAKEIEWEAAERKQKLEERGKKQQKKEGTGKAMMDKLKNDSEKSASRLKGVHAGKVGAISQELSELRSTLPELDKMKFGFDNSSLHKGKILITAKDINYGYGDRLLWKEPLSFQITSGERIALTGLNGSGKTTLLKLILGKIEPRCGTIYRADRQAVYIDQDYSLIDNQLTVYEQAQRFNYSSLPEHEIKIRLNRFLFSKEYWDMSCNTLSGGEKMRLMLCCLTISNQAPDLIILDEPTNNLDIQNIGILTGAINEYKGTLLVVSHDTYFLEQVNIERMLK
ncbi:MAG: ATP-binding cassette domain-containing protein [Candidatus Symbiothrix sp.]|jgi:ATPase subunit of ABC transporter with duplicated ATPase domains|nr:ATP-binding cassette domain-containing protein [Candidatus Symbiothrix sp.]